MPSKHRHNCFSWLNALSVRENIVNESMHRVTFFFCKENRRTAAITAATTLAMSATLLSCITDGCSVGRGVSHPKGFEYASRITTLTQRRLGRGSNTKLQFTTYLSMFET